MAYTPLSDDEIFVIANSLEDYHKVFYTFFEMSSVLYCDDEDGITTAAVRFYPDDRKPDLILNRNFWANQNHREKQFIIIHECLHVILCHGERIGSEIPGATWNDINRAQDITINEMAVDVFGFNRDDIRDWKKYCWIDTCFQYPQLVKRNETFVYYLDLLVQEQKQDQPELVDVHFEPGQGGGGAGEPKKEEGNSTGNPMWDDQDIVREKMEDMAEKLAGELSPDELEKLLNSFPAAGAGAMAGMLDVILDKKLKHSKINFHKLVKHLKRTRVKMKESDKESFVVEDRRFQDVMRTSKVILPGKRELEKPSKDRLLTVLFMDISGSCIHYVPTFNKVYNAFDAEKGLFEIRAFAFDTRVVEIFPNSQLRVGGGTSFDILEDKVRELTAEYGKHPDAVIVISDGDSNTPFDPIAPNRWVWLLTEYPRYDRIPTTSKAWEIKDVVFK